MKTTTLFCALLCCCLVGCVSTSGPKANYLYGSPGSHAIVNANPSMSMASRNVVTTVCLSFSKGLGPASVANGYDALFGASGSVLWQPNLHSDSWPHWYTSVSGEMSYSRISVHPDAYSKTLLDALNIPWNHEFSSLDSDASVRVGLVGKVSTGMLAAFGEGLVTYETGDYFDFRKQYDGIGNLYNKDANPVSFGWGAGLDCQLGSLDQWAVGSVFDVQVLYNRAPSSGENLKAQNIGITDELYWDWKNVHMGFQVGLTQYPIFRLGYRF